MLQQLSQYLKQKKKKKKSQKQFCSKKKSNYFTDNLQTFSCPFFFQPQLRLFYRIGICCLPNINSFEKRSIFFFLLDFIKHSTKPLYNNSYLCNNLPYCLTIWQFNLDLFLQYHLYFGNKNW